MDEGEILDWDDGLPDEASSTSPADHEEPPLLCEIISPPPPSPSSSSSRALPPIPISSASVSPTPEDDLRELLASGPADEEDIGEALPPFSTVTIVREDPGGEVDGQTTGVLNEQPNSQAIELMRISEKRRKSGVGGSGDETMVESDPFADDADGSLPVSAEESSSRSSLAYLHEEASTSAGDVSISEYRRSRPLSSTSNADEDLSTRPLGRLTFPSTSTLERNSSISSSFYAPPSSTASNHHEDDLFLAYQETQEKLHATQSELEQLQAEIVERERLLDEDFDKLQMLLNQSRKRAQGSATGRGRDNGVELGSVEGRRETTPTPSVVHEAILSEIRELRQQLPSASRPVPPPPTTINGKTDRLAASPERNHHEHGEEEGDDDLYSTAPYSVPVNADLAEMARLATMLQDAYTQIDILNSQQASIKMELSAALAREKLARATLINTTRAETSSSNTTDDSSAVRLQLMALNARIDDVVFLMLDQIGAGELENGISDRVKREICDIAEFKTYAALVRMKGTSSIFGPGGSRTLADFLTDGFKTVMLKTLYNLIFKPFKVGLEAEADGLVRALYSSMDEVPQEKVSKWRFLTYASLPSHDETSFVDDLSAGLIAHFESVLRACGIPQFSLGRYKNDISRLIQEALKWRARTRTTCIGDFEPFLLEEDFISGRERERRGERIGGDRVSLGFRGFGLVKLDRMQQPGKGEDAKVEPFKVVLMSSQPIVEGEEASGS